MQTLEVARELIKRNGPKEPFLLDFERVSEEALRCRCCKQFTIGRYQTRDGTFYEVWFKATGGQALQLRTNLTTGTDAKNWASAIAAAYRRGNISLKAPPTKEEIEGAERARKAG